MQQPLSTTELLSRAKAAAGTEDGKKWIQRFETFYREKGFLTRRQREVCADLILQSESTTAETVIELIQPSAAFLTPVMLPTAVSTSSDDDLVQPLSENAQKFFAWAAGAFSAAAVVLFLLIAFKS